MSDDTKYPMPEKGSAQDEEGGREDHAVAAVENNVVVNASGYRDELKRQYSLLALAGVALTVDNAWVALGSSISVSIRMLPSPGFPA
jgi:choline transport protein